MAIQDLLYKALMGSDYLMEQEKLKLLKEDAIKTQSKEEREWISSVSKGEVPATAIPESLRKKIFKGPRVSAEGLTGRTEGLQNIPYGAKIAGTPEFMKRVTQQETPEVAQQRLMSNYAQQQQAINPYRALGGQKLEARQQIEDLVNSGTPLEKVPVELKIRAGYMTPEAGSGRGININLGGLDLGGGQPQKQTKVSPDLLTEENIKFTMKETGLTREEVLKRLGVK